jgi:hypothetical protein
MARKKKVKTAVDEKTVSLLGVDVDLGLYELTDLFHAFYKYHNEDCQVEYEEVVALEKGKPVIRPNSLSRFQALRRIEAARLGSRPFLSGEGIAKHKPNVSLGYMSLMLSYLTLPFKSIFTDSDLVRVRVNRRQYQLDKLSDREIDELKLAAKSNPNLTNNKEISDDFSDAYSNIIKRSKKLGKIFDTTPRRVNRDGITAFVNSDVDWTPELVDALDLVTEPQAEHDTSTWSTFFVIKKMTAHEAVQHIRKPGLYWNAKALSWALESATNNRGLLSGKHYNTFSNLESSKFCGENFSVKSFYADRSQRLTNIGSYYGNMLVVEAYYYNKNGKINKSIFFPSEDFLQVSKEQKDARALLLDGKAELPKTKEARDAQEQMKKEFECADILFHRTDVFDSMEQAVTTIPFDRAELSLERQRGYGHEIFSPIEMAMRLDSAILNITLLISVPFYKNRAAGTDAQDLLDLTVNVNGDMQDIGERDFVEIPFRGDLNSMLTVRSVLLQHVAAKCFLGGLDGGEQQTNGRGANLANLRLIRDGRIHKHTTEDFAKGLTELFTKMFRRVLDMKDKELVDDDVLLKKTFYDVLIKVHGYDPDIFEFKKEDIVPDSGLPYWMEVEAIRNGGSHFGAAELVLYSEIKQVFGDGLSQSALDSLNRMGIKSLLGQQDALDILGDPKDILVTEKDQIYRASLENAAILGSVDQGTINFEQVDVNDEKDDHVAHLTQKHNPKAQEIIKRLQENDVSTEKAQEMSINQLETRNSLILKLGALANHISMHLQGLARFGDKRPDINQLREETNAILQSAEGLMNSLQINLRILDQKRAEEEQKLLNMSPENEAEKLKQQTELERIQASREDSRNKLMLANKIADQQQQQHIDKQLTKARDRTAKERLAERQDNIKKEEIQIKASMETKKLDAMKTKKVGGESGS